MRRFRLALLMGVAVTVGVVLAGTVGARDPDLFVAVSASIIVLGLLVVLFTVLRDRRR